MKALQRTGWALLALGVAGLFGVALFLWLTPPSAFDTQGPGLLGAFALFFSQLFAALGLTLLIVHWAMTQWRGRRR